MLTRDALLKRKETLKQSLKREKVTLRNLEVYIREVTGNEKEVLDSSCLSTNEIKQDGKVDMKFDHSFYTEKLLAISLCDEKGNTVFQFEDYKIIGDCFSTSEVTQLTKVAQRLNGLTDLEKNGSGGDTPAISSSSSV
jgi:hypothetical protein